MLVVLLAVVAIGVYVFADRISAAIPAAKGPLDAYVIWADGFRTWLEALAQDWVDRLSRIVDSVKSNSDT
jgi:hypothetical protein